MLSGAFLLVALCCMASGLTRAQQAQYWGSFLAYNRVPFEHTPHGNFFNNLPAVPDDVRAVLPQQDGSIFWNRLVLARNKELYLRGHPMAVQLVKGLMNQANLVYDTPIYTITEKPSAPKNESKRYYWSIGPYFWPSQITPENPRGEPYTRRDGVFNAQLEITHPDSLWLRDTISACKWLGLAYFFTEDAKYAEQLKQRIYTFFIDPVTGMLPSLRFAQSIPGQVDGRPQGTIDMRHIGDALDAVRIVEWMDPALWTPEDDAALQDWFQRYIDGWLVPQRVARTERASENNHGTYYDVQLISVLKYLKRYEHALQVAHYSQYRYSKQIVHGEQPYEFVRASSVHYLTFNTMALTNLATICKTLGIDTWHTGLRHGYSLKDAFDFAVPHALTRAAYWPWKQVNDEFDFDRFGLVFGDVYKAFTANGTVPGPYSYVVLNREFWTSPDFLARFKGNFIKAFLAENLFRIEADSEFATKSLPEPPCEDLSCDTFSRIIVITAGILLLSCIGCICFNNLVYYAAERTPGLPYSLRELADQQERILTKEENLYIQQLAPKAYFAPIYTRDHERNSISTHPSANGTAKK